MTTSLTAVAGEFAAAVKYAARWAPAKPVIPAHGCVLGRFANGQLRLHGYGETASGHATIPVEAGEGTTTSFLVSARLLDSIAQTLSAGEVLLDVDETTLNVASGRFRATLPLMSENDYPALPDVAPLVATVKGDELADAARRVGIAARRDDTIGACWMGVLFQWSHDELMLAASDRYRVVRQVINWDPIAEPPTLMIPAAVLLDATPAFEGREVEIGAQAGEGTGVFSLSTSDRSLTVPLIDHSLFPVAQIGPMVNMPRDAQVTFSVKAAQLPLKRVELLRNVKTDAVVLNMRSGAVEFAASAGNDAAAGDDEIEAEYEGEEASVLLRSKTLHDMLATAPGDRVTMSFVAGSPKPILFTSDANPAWRHVVVPLRNV